jgi:hypothetical protein
LLLLLLPLLFAGRLLISSSGYYRGARWQRSLHPHSVQPLHHMLLLLLFVAGRLLTA